MYINFVSEENKNIYISLWLLLITLLVGLMIIVGGLTRLTDSGLSITKWNLITGIFPPLNIDDWNEAFSLYKKIPEYKLLNSDMTLGEFKTIYWWEFIHRFLGRVIGLSYFLPLIYFTWKNKIKKKSLYFLYMIFLLILLQGFIGWYMVQSGLVERTDVSHYRLSLHLTLAFIIFILLLWNYFTFTNKNKFISYKKLPSYLPIFFIFFLLIQISLGALVSGLDAGKIYQSWPLMDQSYFPDDSNLKDLFSLNLFENPSLLQFIHRNIAYLIFLLFLFIFILVFKNRDFYYLRKTTLSILFLLIFQILLGILTILSGAQILIASLHQIGSIILTTASLMLVYQNSKA